MKTEAEWLKLFAECESSGLSQALFCKQKGVSYWSFYKQRRDLVKRGLLKAARPIAVKQRKPAKAIKSQPFLPIQIAKAPQIELSRMIEIQLPHGIILRIAADVAI